MSWKFSSSWTLAIKRWDEDKELPQGGLLFPPFPILLSPLSTSSTEEEDLILSWLRERRRVFSGQSLVRRFSILRTFKMYAPIPRFLQPAKRLNNPVLANEGIDVGQEQVRGKDGWVGSCGNWPPHCYFAKLGFSPLKSHNRKTLAYSCCLGIKSQTCLLLNWKENPNNALLDLFLKAPRNVGSPGKF